jgi:hypothetical protein
MKFGDQHLNLKLNGKSLEKKESTVPVGCHWLAQKPLGLVDSDRNRGALHWRLASGDEASTGKWRCKEVGGLALQWLHHTVVRFRVEGRRRLTELGCLRQGCPATGKRRWLTGEELEAADEL